MVLEAARDDDDNDTFVHARDVEDDTLFHVVAKGPASLDPAEEECADKVRWHGLHVYIYIYNIYMMQTQIIPFNLSWMHQDVS